MTWCRRDLRVVVASGLRVDESAFTGESAPAGKGGAPVAADTALAERSNMLFAGTAGVAGGGRAVVVAVGVDSELGRLGRLVAEADPGRSALQRSPTSRVKTCASWPGWPHG